MLAASEMGYHGKIFEKKCQIQNLFRKRRSLEGNLICLFIMNNQENKSDEKVLWYHLLGHILKTALEV